MEKKIIWADDDEKLMEKSELIFNDNGFTIIKCNSIAEALKQVMIGASNNLLLDIDFPGNPKEGLIFLEEIKRINPSLNIVLFTGFPELDDAVNSIKSLLASDYIAKPIPLSADKRTEFFNKLHNSFQDISSNGGLVTTKQNNYPIKLLRIKNALESYDVDSFISILQSIFAGLSYNIKTNESYYHAFIHIILDIIGVKIDSEVETNLGRIDAVVETEKYLYLMEFKLSDASIAIKQIKENKYFQKYLDIDKQVILLGIAFDKTEKNIKNHISEIYKA